VPHQTACAQYAVARRDDRASPLPANAAGHPLDLLLRVASPSLEYLWRAFVQHRDLQSALPVRKFAPRDRGELQSPAARLPVAYGHLVRTGASVRDAHRFSLPMGPHPSRLRWVLLLLRFLLPPPLQGSHQLLDSPPSQDDPMS
jgi:hypothetical protein